MRARKFSFLGIHLGKFQKNYEKCLLGANDKAPAQAPRKALLPQRVHMYMLRTCVQAVSRRKLQTSRGSQAASRLGAESAHTSTHRARSEVASGACCR